MPNLNASMWPFGTSAGADAATPNAPWGLGEAIETQARLWNHLLDANRSFWSLYTPWLQMGPWAAWSTAPAPQEAAEEAVEEQAQNVDNIPAALETQARSWNHFLDANRSLWTSFAWPVPGAPWIVGGQEAAEPTPPKKGRSADVIDMPAKQHRTRASSGSRSAKSTSRRAR